MKDSKKRKGLYLGARAIYLLRRLAFENELPESGVTEQAISLLAELQEVWPAVERLAKAKGIKPEAVVLAALERQIPEKYFNE